MGLEKTHGMPLPKDTLGYSETEVRDILWVQFLRFMRGQTVALAVLEPSGAMEARYYRQDVHNFLHEGKMFWD